LRLRFNKKINPFPEDIINIIMSESKFKYVFLENLNNHPGAKKESCMQLKDIGQHIGGNPLLDLNWLHILSRHFSELHFIE